MARVTRRRSFAPAELGLLLFYAASSVAFVRSQQWPGAWLLLLPVLAGLLVEVEDVGERLRRRGERDAWILVGLAIVVGVGWTIYLFVSDTILGILRGVIGSGLVMMGGFFAAGRRVWSPGRGLIPTGLGALTIAGLDALAPITVPSAVAALGLLGWLGLERPTKRRPGAPVRPRVGLVLVVLLAVALALGISVGLPLAQPLVEQAAADVLSGSGQGTSGLSSSARLGDIESLALSREVVLRLWSDLPLRLRAYALTTFDGQRWTGAVGAPQPMRPLAPEPGGWLGDRLAELPGQSFGEASGELDWARVLVAQVQPSLLLAPAGPRVVRVAGGVPMMDPAGLLHATFWPPPRLYGAAYAAGSLRGPTPEERAAGLQLPEGLDPRLGALAAELGEGAAGDRERLDRTVRWIGDECDYSLNVGAFRTDQPVAEFLFEKKRGYCEYFASSAALLLRLQGVPARYVSGFNVRDQNRRGDHFLVRGGDAHAWVEAWIEGVGWVEADPTPAAQYDALRDGMRDGLFARVWESVSAFFTELQARMSNGGDLLRWLGRRVAALGAWIWARVGEIVVVVLVVATGMLLWRRRGRLALRRRCAAAVAPPAAVDPALGALVSRLERRWSELGHPRLPHRPPLEHLLSLPDDAVPEGERAAGRAVVDCYYRARYGGRAPDAETLERLGRELSP